MAADFDRVVAYLEREESSLKALKAKDLKECLRSGAGTRQREANPERMKYYKLYMKIEKHLTPQQKESRDEWQKRLCSEGEDVDFSRLVAILTDRKEELRQMRKPSLKDCFNTHRSNEDHDFCFARNFFRRVGRVSTKEEESFEDVEFARLAAIVEGRKDELRAMRKPDIRACFVNYRQNDSDFAFARSLFRSEGRRFTVSQDQVLQAWKREICVTEQDPFERFVWIVESREEELSAMGKPDFHALFSSHSCKEDKDLKFCQNYWTRIVSQMSEEPALFFASLNSCLVVEQLDELEARICVGAGDGRAALWPAVVKFDAILDRRRKEEFAAVGAASVQSLFARHSLKTDKELRFCYNFVSRVFPKLD
eukprot:s956_g18.t1